MRPLRAVESQWIFDYSALEQSPSSHDGIQLEQELDRRRNCILMIRSLALRTHLVTEGDHYGTAARHVLTTASVFLHRFYMRRSLNDFPEPILAATIFFLASKVEEQAVKLRHIVNACLLKFEKLREDKMWDPHRPGDPGPGTQYRRWEAEILAAEEIVLETLCFDLGVEQPWALLQKSIRGLDSLRSGELGDPAGDEAQWQAPQDLLPGEGMILEIGWTLLNEAYLSPVCVLHHPLVIAFAALVIVFALATETPILHALDIAAELGWRFELDIAIDANYGITGVDEQPVKDCVVHMLQFAKMGICNADVLSLIPDEAAEPFERPLGRRFRSKSESEAASQVATHADEGTKAPSRPIAA